MPTLDSRLTYATRGRVWTGFYRSFSLKPFFNQWSKQKSHIENGKSVSKFSSAWTQILTEHSKFPSASIWISLWARPAFSLRLPVSSSSFQVVHFIVIMLYPLTKLAFTISYDDTYCTLFSNHNNNYGIIHLSVSISSLEMLSGRRTILMIRYTRCCEHPKL